MSCLAPARALLAAAVLALSACALAQPTPDAPDPGVLVVLHQAGASAWLLDAETGTVVARLPTGVGPHEVAVSPDGRRAVVTDYGDRQTVGASLTVLDLSARAVERTVPLGDYERPHGVAFLPGGRVAVTAERDSALVVVDLDAGAIVSVATTGQQLSHLLALSSDGRTAYTGNILSGTVSRVDLTGSQPPAVAHVGPIAEAVALRPDGLEVWAASQETGRVVAFDAATLDEVGAATVAGRPYRIAFTPDGARALVTTSADVLHVLDAHTRQPAGTVSFDAGSGPAGIAVAPDGRRAYVTLTALDRVAVVDLDALAVVGLFETGPVPDGIAFVAPVP